MRRVTVLLALGALTAGCGSTKPLSETARPCLAKLGRYVHHRPRPIPPRNTLPPLPVIDPDYRPDQGRSFSLIWPDDLDEYGEISFDSKRAGANAVQVMIFKHEELPKRVMSASARLVRFLRKQPQQAFFFPGPQPVRHDRTLIVWSSAPTAQQKRAVYACLEG